MLADARNAGLPSAYFDHVITILHGGGKKPEQVVMKSIWGVGLEAFSILWQFYCYEAEVEFVERAILRLLAN
jgi:hypothetical protein